MNIIFTKCNFFNTLRFFRENFNDCFYINVILTVVRLR